MIGVSELFNFVGGVDFNRQWAYTNTNVDHEFPQFNPFVENWGAASQTGLYGQVRSTLFSALTLSLGGRMDWVMAPRTWSLNILCSTPSS